MDNRQKVLNWIEEHRDEVVEFLQKLIRAKSVNPYFEHEDDEIKEGAVQKIIREHMEELGAEIDMWEPDVQALAKYEGYPGFSSDFDSAGRPNVVATIKGCGEGKSIALMGHTDTVARGTGWSKDPFGGEVENGYVYGRGAVDMKGGIAAMIKAVDAIVKTGIKLPGDISVATIIAEENPGIGTLAYIERGYRPDAAIMTEATKVQIAPLCRGVIWGKLTIEGRSGHIELPQHDWRQGGAVDAIKKARMFLQHFDYLNEEWRITKTHPLLKVPCQIYVGKVEMGEFISTYANKAVIYFDATYLPRERDQKGGGGLVMKEIERLIDTVTQTDSWLSEHPPVLEWQINADCGETDIKHPLIHTMEESLKTIGREPVVEGSYFHTDMGWVEKAGIPIVNFGPGDPAQAHSSDEMCPIDDLIDTTKAIALTILDWCQQKKEE